MIECANKYTLRGWAVLPLNPGEKTPATSHGVKDATLSPSVWPEGANIGIACGPVSDLFVVDLDGAKGIANFRELLVEHQIAVNTPIVQTPSGGFHLYYRHFEGARNTVCQLGDKIDTRSKHGYVVAPPSTLTAGGVYGWVRPPSSVNVAEFPPVLRALLNEHRSSYATAANAPGRSDRTAHDEERVRAALRAVPADCNRDEWISIGFALNDHFGDSGFGIWDEWSKTAPDKYNAWAIRSAWRSMRPGRGIGIARVFHIAKQYGADVSAIVRTHSDSYQHGA